MAQFLKRKTARLAVLTAAAILFLGMLGLFLPMLPASAEGAASAPTFTVTDGKMQAGRRIIPTPTTAISAQSIASRSPRPPM